MEAQKLAALRNRENQRRSRARRKDYIQELEQRLRHYEVAGVKATAEVQAAARKVSEENSGLRSLLDMCGVDAGRIEEFLRTGDASSKDISHDVKTKVASPPRERASIHLCAATHIRTPPTLETDVCTKDMQPMAKTPEAVQAVPHAISYASESHTISQMTADRDRTEAPTLHVAELSMPSATSSANVESPTSSDQGQGSGAHDEISCVAAAEIIAGMRGHDNPEEVWPELGCSTSRKCMVKNMAIFQIMDQ
ncbi:hypothetical protein GJ744_005996 [Endocarpon pusillum]|uniref:BZIP domain-containing protein n=1 Tax=Endocarpon pusillum TaxID=364733 RepID=A0A8H7ABT8_9EURO|nr:hypothetical protein GJ744_005996 [Endocarpon pusillum]